MRVCYIGLVLLFCILETRGGDHPDGNSQVSRAQDALGNYHFRYTVRNGEGEQFREEGRDAHGSVSGSYGLTHADGTHRVVDYVADKSGFRAHVRSNEPGVATADSADASVERTDTGASLSVAATSQFGDKLPSQNGHRLTKTVLRSQESETSDETPKETRQRDFEDYRPLNPIAYYPGSARGFRRPDDSTRSPRLLDNDHEEELKSPGAYFPPINPHRSVMRRPADNSNGNFFSTPTSSRRPYIPPYGGFDDDPVPIRPVISITTIHGGLGPRFPPPTPPTSLRGVKVQHPQNEIRPSGIDHLNIPRHPLDSGMSTFGRTPLNPIHAPQGRPFYGPPYGSEPGPQRFVLRAVPIPNGIQAVRVDPTSGRVYERLVYPLFFRHDGVPTYDRNILLYDEDEIEHDEPTDSRRFIDSHFSSDRNRGQGSVDRTRIRRYNGTFNFDDKSLGEPSSNDLDWIQRQLSLVEDFDKQGLRGRTRFNTLSSDGEDSELREAFGEDESKYGRSNRIIPSGRFEFSDDSFSRAPRHESLISEDTKESLVQVQTEPKQSYIESEKSDTETES